MQWQLLESPISRLTGVKIPITCDITEDSTVCHQLVIQQYPFFSNFAIAARAGGVDVQKILRILVEGGCPTQSLNHVGESPLLLAVQNGHLPVVEFLVGKGVLVSDEIIHAACGRDSNSPRAPIVKLLLQHGVDHDTSDRHGDTPLHTLMRTSCSRDCDCLQTALLLVAAGYNPVSLGDDGEPVVQIAAQNGHISIVQFLLDRSVEATPDLFRTVAHCDHPETFAVVQSLWQRGTDPDILEPSWASGDTLLHCLAGSPRPQSHQARNYLDIVRHLCQVGKFDPSLPNWHGETVLHLAAREGNLDLVRYLLDLGCALPADILHSAIKKVDPWSPNSGQVAELLIDRGAPVDSRNHRGDTLLHSLIKNVRWANHTRSTDLFHRIVALDICDINALDAFGKAPLHYAAERGLSSYVQLLLGKGARIPTDIMHSAIRPFWPGPTSCVQIQMFLQDGTPLDLVCSKNGNTLLHTFLIYNGRLSNPAHVNPAITRYVIETQGCNIHSLNLQGESPIFLAFKHHDVMVAEYLLARGARVPAGIVHTVLRKHRHRPVNVYERLISLILCHGETIHSPSSEGGNALHSLLRGHRWDTDERELGIAQFLVLQGCDVNAQDFDGRTPLHHAARNDNLAAVRFLIYKGAQVPEDILHDALANNKKSFHTIVHLLLEHGASITARTKGGDTVLHTVLRRSARRSPTAYLHMARLLIDKGCELNVLNSFGESPLHLAAQLGYISIVRLLLDKGAKLYGGVIYSAVKSLHSASFEPILKMLIHGGLADQTIFFEREDHGFLHILCQNAVRVEALHTKYMHKIHVLLGCGLHVEKHVNTEDSKGFTPLGMVLNRELPCPSLVSYLIDIGAKFSDVNYLHLDNLYWARELSWYPDAVKAYHAMLERQPINLTDILDVQTALACRFSLPPRVVNRILEVAGYWACGSVTYQKVEFTYRQSKLFLSLPWLSSDVSKVKLRRMVISYKVQDGEIYCKVSRVISDSTPGSPFILWSGISVTIQRQGVKPTFLRIYGNNLPSEVTNLIGTVVWDRYDPITEDDGFSLNDLVHGDTLCFERDMDIDPEKAEIELEFLRIHMYYTVDSY
jgi:ankyrin repeat protein